MNNESQPAESIAIIGMAGRFPGAANPDEFWQNLIAAKDAVTRFDGRAETGEGKFVAARGILDDADKFDAAFFGISPEEAELMDPQQRIFLECSWEALEDGGYDPLAYPGMIGVYAGISPNTYLLHNLGKGRDLATNDQVAGYETLLGDDKELLPVRVSHKLNLTGPSMTIQSGCSSSLVAICQAATALLAHQCDMALAGGVSVSFPQRRDDLFREEDMVSPDGTCRAFDAEAAGTVFGHGCGVILLKRLSEAVADRDPILGIMRGWAVNNDGSEKTGFAASDVNAQSDVITMAQAAAGVEATQISYVEADGSGTPLGDAIEVEALTKAFREGAADENSFCALGTCKTHIGHLDCAAGVAGVIKLMQQFQHGKIPGLLHFKSPNPRIDFSNSPFYPVAETRDWPRSGTPRIAGISAFGAEGTNSHVILEEPPLPAITSPGRKEHVLTLSAKSGHALDQMANALAACLGTDSPELADVAYTLATGRRAFSHRCAIVAADLPTAIARLRDTPTFTTAPATHPRIAFLFPGQGSQYFEMGREIYDSEPAFRQAVDECAVILRPMLRRDIRATLYPSEHEREAAKIDINETAITQPCIFVIEYALAKLWISWGIVPSLLIGHSIGEYVAAVIAGSFKLENALHLLSTRARLMQGLPGGSMLAIHLGAGDIKLPEGVDLAAINNSNLCTVSGPNDAIAGLQRDLEARHIGCRLLTTSHAFHSAMMQPIVGTFTDEASMVPVNPPSIPWISTVTGKPVDAATLADASYWSRQLRHTVNFAGALATAFADKDLIMLEVGPGQALAPFARQHPDRGTMPVISTLPTSAGDLTDLGNAIGELWKNGVAFDWQAYFSGQQRAKRHLPTYRFDRQSYWIDNSAMPKPETGFIVPALPVATSAEEPVAGIRENVPPAFVPMVATAGTHSLVRWPAQLPKTEKTDTRFGPYKPIAKGEQGGLTETQAAALSALIDLYVAKTPSSKAYAAKHRPHYADPRAAAGFKSLWKEMVYPIVSQRSKGSKLWDPDGNEYVDITMGFGSSMFGHSPDWLIEAIEKQLKTGIEIGPQSPLAGKLAAAICDLTGMERVTFCNTGSEAVMAAMRLARTITGRDRIVYFAGDYHGMFEEVLVRGTWVDGVYRSQPIAPGIPQSLVDNILVLDYADPASLEILRAHSHELAAVMVEPVQSRAPGLQPRDFMREVREITERSGTALIFDEIVTGFRCAPSGAQAYFGVQADLATYGKALGGGMPIGVLAGKRKYMDALDGGAWNYGDESFPEAGVTFFGGTFVRHPLALAAASRVVEHIKSEGPRLQIDLAERVSRLCRALNDWFEAIQMPIRLQYFSAYATIEHSGDLKHASLLWYYLRERGIHVWEGRPLHFTTAHTDEDMDRIVKGFAKSVAQMQAAGFLPASADPNATMPLAFPRLDSAPTTEAQREIFHAVLMGDEANCSFNQSNIIGFDGPLDSSALRTALTDLVTRHPALRSSFSQDGSTQYFHPSKRTIEMMEHDFSNLGMNSPSASLPLSLIKNAESSIPFDLTQGPLFRLNLVRLSADRHELIFTAHHIICDDWSFGLLLAELATAYNARKAGRLPVLPPAMSFGEYARLEMANKNDPEALATENYWVGKFADDTPVLDLPTDRPRPRVKTYGGAMEAITLDVELFIQLKKATPKLGGTLFATLLASFAALLHRLTGQEDLVIGVPAAGQTRMGCDELIGHCLNILPLRLKPAGERRFSDFAGEVKEQVLEAYDHQNYTFGSLLQKIKVPRDASRVPLVSVIFNIDKSGIDQIRFDDLKLDVATNPKQSVNSDLFFNLVQSEEKLVIECEYNTSLHDRKTIRRWLGAFERIIESIVENGDDGLRDLDILTDEDRRQIDKWNATDRLPPAQRSMHRFFEEQAERTPDAIALRDGERALTYREFDRHANALAGELVRNGVMRETLVGVCAERRAETLVAILAVLKAGGAYVPIDPTYPKDRIAFILKDANAPLLLTQRALVPLLPQEDNYRGIFIDHVLDQSADGLHRDINPGDLAYVIYSSNSTGLPRGVATEHRNAIALIGWAKDIYSSEELAGVLFSTSISFDLSIFEIFVTLASGGTIILAENVLDLRDHPHRDQVTLINTVSSAISELLDADLIPPSVRTINLAGEALPTSLVDRLSAAHSGVKIYELYGHPEATTYSTFTLRKAGERATIGRPIWNTKAYIASSRGKLLPPGFAGELLVGGAGIARGYLNRPELTAEKFIPNTFDPFESARLYRTGDRARFYENGEIQFLGSLDRNAMPQPLGSEGRDPQRTFVAPRNATEEKLLDIWKAVLGNELIGVEDDIFELGGDSILISQIATRAGQAGLALTPAQVFRQRTIAAIAAEVTAAAAPAFQTTTISRVNREAYRRNI